MPRSTGRNNREVHGRPIDLQADEGLISLLRDQPPLDGAALWRHRAWSRHHPQACSHGLSVRPQRDQMDNTTLLIIIILVVILLGGGWYGRGRWF
jgi:hypothetical protein